MFSFPQKEVEKPFVSRLIIRLVFGGKATDYFLIDFKNSLIEKMLMNCGKSKACITHFFIPFLLFHTPYYKYS